MNQKLGTAYTIGEFLTKVKMYSGDCKITPVTLEYVYENGHPAKVDISFEDRPLTLAETKREIIDPFLHKEEADEVLREFNDICIERGIFYVLACGTCLGFYRDGGYIDGDNDIDIIIDPKDLDKLTKVMVERGFKLGRRGGSQHYIKYHVLLDVWLAPRILSAAMWGYKNMSVPLPSDTEGYLTALYGDWRTPSKQSAKEAVHRSYK